MRLPLSPPCSAQRCWPPGALPAALLLIACGFGWHDIRKNRRKNRSPILLDSALEENIRHPEKLRGQIRFRIRPNIYLFYLESMHSSKAVRALYGIDGTDIDRFLEKNGFTLYPDFLSTACWTAGTAFACLPGIRCLMRPFPNTP